MLNESEHDSPKKNDNATYEILSEDEFIKRETNPSDSDSEDNFELSYDEDKQVELVPKNPFADFVLNEEPGVYNFDNELLQKGKVGYYVWNEVTHLDAYSIDPEYVAPEELVMRKILSSKNPSISFYLWNKTRFLNGQEAASEFVIGWRKNFVEVRQWKSL